jgi:hypothetical protein
MVATVRYTSEARTVATIMLFMTDLKSFKTRQSMYV